MTPPRRGANAVEFALLLPLFVTVVALSMDMGWLMFQRGAVRTAVAHGCRAAAMLDPGPNEDNLAPVLAQAEAKVLAGYEAQGGLCQACVAVADAVGVVPQRSLRCRLSAPHGSLTHLFPGVGSLEDTVVVRFEHQRRMQ